MSETYEKFELTIDRKTLALIMRQVGPKSTPEEAVKYAVGRCLATLSKLVVDTETLAKIANLSDRPPIKSEYDLLKAFEVVTGLNDTAFVITVDPVVAFPMLVEVAKGQGRSIADVVREYISHSAANGGFFTEHVPYRYFNLTPAQYGHLAKSLGVEHIRDGSELVDLVAKLALQSTEAKAPAKGTELVQ